jgi:multiple sugar transport system ATP-binding protein
MHDGILQQVGTPSEVYQNPANLFVAQFIGSPVMNITDAAITQSGDSAAVTVDSESFAMPRELIGMLQAKGAEQISLGVRPEGVLLSHDEQPGYRPVEAHLIQPYGPFDIVDLKVGNRVLRSRTHTGFVARPGDRVWARIDPAQAHFFDSKSGNSLGIELK